MLLLTFAFLSQMIIKYLKFNFNIVYSHLYSKFGLVEAPIGLHSSTISSSTDLTFYHPSRNSNLVEYEMLPGRTLFNDASLKGRLFVFISISSPPPVSLDYLPYYWKLFDHIWQLYTLGMEKNFHMLKLDL